MTHDDRRLHPRVVTDLSARVEAGPLKLPVQMVNLSLGGFLVEGDGQLTGLPASASSGSIELNLSFDLESLEVSSFCRVVYKRRLSADKAALGLKILEIDERARDAIDNYVRSNLSY